MKAPSERGSRVARRRGGTRRSTCRCDWCSSRVHCRPGVCDGRSRPSCQRLHGSRAGVAIGRDWDAQVRDSHEDRAGPCEGQGRHEEGELHVSNRHSVDVVRGSHGMRYGVPAADDPARRVHRLAYTSGADVRRGRTGRGDPLPRDVRLPVVQVRGRRRLHAAADGGPQHEERGLDAVGPVGLLRTSSGDGERGDPRRSAPARGVSEHSVVGRGGRRAWPFAAPVSYRVMPARVTRGRVGPFAETRASQEGEPDEGRLGARSPSSSQGSA